MAEKTKASHSTSSIRKARYISYRALKVREKNKLPRVLQSCGVVAAQAYAQRHGLGGLLAQIARRRGIVLESG